MNPALKHLNFLDYVVILCYLFIVAGVGFVLVRFNRNTGDYFKAGGRLPWVISSISLFVSGFSAFMFVSAAGYTYRNGLSSILLFSSGAGGYALGLLVFGKLWHRARIDSPMQLLSRRYSQSTTYFYSLLAVVPNILLMGALIYTLCIFISSALGLGSVQITILGMSLSGFELTAVTIGMVLLLYTTLGGLWAVAITDTLQFLILLLMTLTVFPLSYAYLGEGSILRGIAELRRQAPPGYLSLNPTGVSVLFLAAFWFQNLLGYNANWHIGQRYYSVPDERDTQKMAAMCGVFSILAPLLWILPVLAARVIFPDLGTLWPDLTEPTEASFASLCLLILPHGMLGVVVSAILAASMSSADSTFNWLAAVVTKDVYAPAVQRLRRGTPPSERSQLLVGKSTVVVAGIVAIVLSLGMQKFGSSFDIYLQIYSITTPAMFTPVLLGMIYRRTPWWSAMAAVAAGTGAIFMANLLANRHVGLPVHRLSDFFGSLELEIAGLSFGRYEINVFVGILATASAFFLSALWPNRHPESARRLAEFDRDLRTPIRSSQVQLNEQGIYAYRLVGRLSVLIGGFLMILAIPVEGLTGKLINLITGIGAAVFGLLFQRLSARYLPEKNA